MRDEKPDTRSPWSISVLNKIFSFLALSYPAFLSIIIRVVIIIIVKLLFPVELQDPQSDWQKVDYLLEFGEWLFVNEFPVDDATDQVCWKIMLNHDEMGMDGLERGGMEWNEMGWNGIEWDELRFR